MADFSTNASSSATISALYSLADALRLQLTRLDNFGAPHASEDVGDKLVDVMSTNGLLKYSDLAGRYLIDIGLRHDASLLRSEVRLAFWNTQSFAYCLIYSDAPLVDRELQFSLVGEFPVIPLHSPNWEFERDVVRQRARSAIKEAASHISRIIEVISPKAGRIDSEIEPVQVENESQEVEHADELSPEEELIALEASTPELDVASPEWVSTKVMAEKLKMPIKKLKDQRNRGRKVTETKDGTVTVFGEHGGHRWRRMGKQHPFYFCPINPGALDT